MLDRAICPVCLQEYGLSRLRGRGTCPDCDSEAMEIGLVRKKKLLERMTLEELVGHRDRWAADTSFLPEYHAAKLQRLDRLLREKRSLDAASRKARPPRPP